MLRSRASRPSALWSNDLLPELPRTSSDEDNPKRVRLRRTNTEVFHHPSKWRKVIIFVVLVSFLSLILWFIHYLKPRPFSFINTPAILIPPSLTGTNTHTHRGQLDRDHKARPPRRSQSKQQSKTLQRTWPPLVSLVPETRPNLDKFYAGLTPSSVDAQFCNEAPKCQFLLPLWIGEQESRSRIHIIQVLQLAQALNRTLVLPNVGKSRLGACSRWDFEVYYDVASLVGKMSPEEAFPIKLGLRKAMLMDDFKTWLELRPEKPSSQLVFVDEKIFGEKIRTRGATLFPGLGAQGPIQAQSRVPLDVYVDRDLLDRQDPRLKKTKCLSTKFRQLDLDTFFPVSVHLPLDETQKSLVSSDALLGALIRPDVRSHSFLGTTGEDESDTVPPTPDVLVVHWDIRHFPFLYYTPSNLQYSAKLLSLSERLTSPYKPYLAIHWRMETVPSNVLPDCAESLVDTLVSMLGDPALANGIKTVWFASDFPWPVSSSPSTSKGNPLAMKKEELFDLGIGVGGYEDQRTMNNMKVDTSARRSNTFGSITLTHVEAIEIFTNAFMKGGALEHFKLTGVAEELDRVRMEIDNESDNEENGGERGRLGRGFNILEDDDDDGVLLEDPGVLGILDKLAAFNAALFVSGTRGCGRVSTFTKQIMEYRGNVTRDQVESIRNVVEVFG